MFHIYSFAFSFALIKILTELEIKFLYCVDRTSYTPLKNSLAAFLLFWAMPAPLFLRSAKYRAASFPYCKEFTSLENTLKFCSLL